VAHGHVKVNGRKVNIPSFGLKVNDIIEIKNSNAARQLAAKNLESAASREPSRTKRCVRADTGPTSPGAHAGPTPRQTTTRRTVSFQRQRIPRTPVPPEARPFVDVYVTPG